MSEMECSAVAAPAADSLYHHHHHYYDDEEAGGGEGGEAPETGVVDSQHTNDAELAVAAAVAAAATAAAATPFTVSRTLTATSTTTLTSSSLTLADALQEHFDTTTQSLGNNLVDEDRGWRARQLGWDLKMDRRNPTFKEQYWKDVTDLQSFLEGQQPRINYYKVQSTTNGKFVKRDGNEKYIPLSMKYLNYSWGVGRNAHLQQKLQETRKHLPRKPNPTQLNVLDHPCAANFRCDARLLFLQQRVRQRAKEEQSLQQEQRDKDDKDDDNESVSSEHSVSSLFVMQEIASFPKRVVWREEAKAEWCLLPETEKDYWRAEQKRVTEMQPLVADLVLKAMRDYPTHSHLKIAQQLGNWCSSTSLHHWMARHAHYSPYMERLVPLLTTAQRHQHVEFATKLQQNWNLPKGKYLWIQFGEKWLYEGIGRYAKKCEQLGLETNLTFIYDKNHYHQVAVVALNGYAFEDEVGNGGSDGIKIGLHRLDVTPKTKKIYIRPNKRGDGRNPNAGENGEVNMADGTGTGSEEESFDVPELSLVPLFLQSVFPAIARLVAPGGPYHGYTPILQGDVNEGPHRDNAFAAYCHAYCTQRKWHWESQPPYMPFVNSLDLAVFPAMSKACAAVLSPLVMSATGDPDETWRACQTAWDVLPARAIGRAFVLARTIADHVVEHEGGTAFLRDDALFHDDGLSEYGGTV